MPNRRWKLTIWNEVPINWVAVRAMMEVASTAQAKIGIRNGVMPGARIRRIVTIRLRAPIIDDQPAKNTATKNICMPSGARTESGG